jgi:putative membrane protein
MGSIGYLATGLFWGLVHPAPAAGHDIQVFFLCCVVVAAAYGGLTVKKSILLVQGLPAALALAAVFLSGG